MHSALWIAILVALPLLAIGAWLVLTYNKLVRLRQFLGEAWSAIDAELQRRHDLIPALVEVVKGHAAHERETLERVTQARAAARNERGVDDAVAKETQLVATLRRLLAVAEAYPELKASERFLDLQHQLVETETRLSKARRFYNANVRAMNNAVGRFPSNLVAGRFGFGPQPYFEVEEAARAAAAVTMNR